MGLTDWARVLVAALVGLGMLVIVPLGLDLLPGAWPAGRRWVWFAGAVPGAVSLWLPRGPLAAGLAVPYLLVALVLAARAWPRLRTAFAAPTKAAGAAAAPAAAAAVTALVTPSIAAGALVAERVGYRLFGFRLDVLALTEAHFHYAGFAAALVAGLVGAYGGGTRGGPAAALAVPAGTGLVLAGFFVGDWLELAGAAVLTAGMWIAAAITLRTVRPGQSDPVVRALLAVAAVVLAATMVLALDWALGHVVRVPYLPLSWMVATHGLANALGFGLCSVLAWRRMGRRPGARPDGA
ncbi:YndJ family protein [Dactylosporangium sp. McL0621]|uniref:YndJ family protein n=1 Tax=Dactylosporangium sp. McL0621 TaxID=3415678 RepID=UPI003CEC28B0